MPSVSVGAMLRQMAGMVGTKDLNDFETRFVTSILRATGEGARTSILTAEQVEKVEQIWERHFSG